MTLLVLNFRSIREAAQFGIPHIVNTADAIAKRKRKGITALQANFTRTLHELYTNFTITTGAGNRSLFHDITGADMEIISFVSAHWLEWLFTGVLAVLSFLFKTLQRQLKEEQEKNQAIADGVQSLLRESIVNGYNRYQDKGFCPYTPRKALKSCTKRITGLAAMMSLRSYTTSC